MGAKVAKWMIDPRHLEPPPFRKGKPIKVCDSHVKSRRTNLTVSTENPEESQAPKPAKKKKARRET